MNRDMLVVFEEMGYFVGRVEILPQGIVYFFVSAQDTGIQREIFSFERTDTRTRTRTHIHILFSLDIWVC